MKYVPTPVILARLTPNTCYCASLPNSVFSRGARGRCIPGGSQSCCPSAPGLLPPSAASRPLVPEPAGTCWLLIPRVLSLGSGGCPEAEAEMGTALPPLSRGNARGSQGEVADWFCRRLRPWRARQEQRPVSSHTLRAPVSGPGHPGEKTDVRYMSQMWGGGHRCGGCRCRCGG